jgi:hypothetical protein
VIRNLDETVLRITPLSFFSCTDRAMHKKRIHVMKFTPKLGVTLAALAALGLAASNAANAAVQADLFSTNDGGVQFTGTAVSPFTNNVYTSGLGATAADGVVLAIGGGIYGNYIDQGAGTTASEPSALLHQFQLAYQNLDSPTGTISISGLGTTPVDVILYAGTDGGSYTLGGTTLTASGAGAAAPATEVFTSGVNYIDFGTLTPVAGAITGTWTHGATNPFGELAAVEVSPVAAVPEASSAIGFGVLLALGGLAIVARKRTVKA